MQCLDGGQGLVYEVLLGLALETRAKSEKLGEREESRKWENGNSEKRLIFLPGGGKKEVLNYLSGL